MVRRGSKSQPSPPLMQSEESNSGKRTTCCSKYSSRARPAVGRLETVLGSARSGTPSEVSPTPGAPKDMHKHLC